MSVPTNGHELFVHRMAPNMIVKLTGRQLENACPAVKYSGNKVRKGKRRISRHELRKGWNK
jgi:hypothetical protein